ncbi:glycoside hydrolase family 16 protein [Aulographum hederae CBS 113979]|uniref:chitinase n=1 Tax=Aulographum hederae CBS 113979 TaxID=1176131 RepID=A0A6G1GSI4_9PEZI|nr:glycoside hydrolase family 16 protein [Aulographum hederae CBS 113979]
MMYSSSILLGILASSVPLTYAQTFSKCNPLEKTCPANPALPASLSSNFKADGSNAFAGWTATSGSLQYDGNGAKFTVAKKGDSPTIASNGYFLFGKVTVTMQAAPGQGIVSSIVLESDDLDEVDWEFTGTDITEVQSNYFGKGDTTTYDRFVWHPVSTPQSVMHTYTVDWKSDSLTWSIDGNVIRTLNYADAKGGSRYPQTPMRVKLGIWAGGDSGNPEGTIEWSGGPTDYSQGPFTMFVQDVEVTNYSPGKEYKYTDNSGSFGSIEVVGGSPVAGPSSAAASSAAASSAPASSAPASSAPPSSKPATFITSPIPFSSKPLSSSAPPSSISVALSTGLTSAPPAAQSSLPLNIPSISSGFAPATVGAGANFSGSPTAAPSPSDTATGGASVRGVSVAALVGAVVFALVGL